MSILLSNILCKHWLELLKDNLKSELIDEYIKKKVNFIYPHYLLNICDTIHYDTIANNDFELYQDFIKITNQKEHSVEIFKNLIETFDINKCGKIKLEYNSNLQKYIVVDGTHRLCILLYKNIIKNDISLEHLDITYDETSINKIKMALSNTTNKRHYNAWHNRTQFGYHSFNIYNINILGQRQPRIRLDIIKKHVDFKNKVVVDFGCNTGGMLHHIPEIKTGYGLDYSSECINSANVIKNVLNYNNTLNFIVQDLNTFNFENFNKNYKIKNIDYIFLLSLGSWVKNWKVLYQKSFEYSNNIILETNNDTEGTPQLLFFKNLGANIKLLSNTSNDDTTKNYGRKTYLIN